MKHPRILSLLLAILLALLPVIPALAEEAYPDADVTLVEPSWDEADARSEGTYFELVSEPYIPDNLEKAIFGNDNRTTIDNPNQYPYSTIAYLVVDKACGCSGLGSGFMVSKDCLMTTSHIVMCSVHNKPITKITMYFGYVSDKNYLCKYETSDPVFWYNPRFFAENGNGKVYIPWDYAYIKVPESIRAQTGNLGVILRDQQETESMPMEVAGYRFGVFTTGTGYLKVVDDGLALAYTIDAEGGNSGCPVFDANYYMVGIHAGEGTEFNYACRFRREIFDEMVGNGFFH